jgi:hypothetical protein
MHCLWQKAGRIMQDAGSKGQLIIYYYLAVLVWISNPSAKARNTNKVNPRINIIKI